MDFVGGAKECCAISKKNMRKMYLTVVLSFAGSRLPTPLLNVSESAEWMERVAVGYQTTISPFGVLTEW